MVLAGFYPGGHTQACEVDPHSPPVISEQGGKPRGVHSMLSIYCRSQCLCPAAVPPKTLWDNIFPLSDAQLPSNSKLLPFTLQVVSTCCLPRKSCKA